MDEMLPSWTDGPAKQAIVEFVGRVTSPGEGYLRPAERVAAFDNDGTLWVEQPLPVQLDFIFRALAAAAQRDASLAGTQPYKAILEQDHDFFTAVGQQRPDAIMALEEALAANWRGTTPAEFDAEVLRYLSGAKSDRFDAPHTELVYRPMLELFDLLRSHEFRIFVCSGGGRDFMRVIAEGAWGLDREDVIGTAPQYEYRDGVLHRTDKVLGGIALGPGKPEHIFATTGRMPAFAGGNADVDIEMLESAAFAMLVVHDDEEREYAYTAAAERALEEAKRQGWNLVSIKNDWKEVF
ncbi:HAD family hydrolase [Streptomyces antibioticus]|uniref:HAD family hydrolase n=1 Tax=Streptomyces antibioticus TaxID=1890 RepID=UPI0033FD582D